MKKTNRKSAATIESIARLRNLLDSCERASSDEEVLKFVVPVQEAARSLRQGAVEGSLSRTTTQSEVAATLHVSKQAVNAEVMRYQRLAALAAASEGDMEDTETEAQPTRGWLSRAWAWLTS